MTNKALENRRVINEIKTELDMGKITYEQAKVKAAPVLAEINGIGRDLAKKYGIKHRDISFNEIMR